MISILFNHVVKKKQIRTDHKCTQVQTYSFLSTYKSCHFCNASLILLFNLQTLLWGLIPFSNASCHVGNNPALTKAAHIVVVLLPLPWAQWINTSPLSQTKIKFTSEQKNKCECDVWIRYQDNLLHAIIT